MGCCSAPSSVYTNFFEPYNKGGEIAWNALDRVAVNINTFGAQASATPEPYENAGKVFGTAYEVISATRFFCIVAKFASGHAFFKYRKVEAVQADGTKTTTWMREWRDFGDILLDICLLVARTLSFVCFLARREAFSLGKHAKNMGTAVGAFFAAVTGIAFIQSVRELVKALGHDIAELKRKVFNLVSAFLDLLAVVRDCGFVVNSPEFMIASGVFSLIGGLFWLAKEMFLR